MLDAISALKVRSCLIDGEIAVCDESGLAVFQRLRHGSRIKPEAVLFAFDLLELDGEDLRTDRGTQTQWRGSCAMAAPPLTRERG